MNMRPSLLKTFLAVARSRNVTRAAAEVHLAQSTVSDQLQLLEAELRTSLFVRSKTGLDLTPAGEALVAYAEEILALTDEARVAVGAATGQAMSSLAIGALETVASGRMPRWIAAFRANHPNIDLQLKIAGSQELLQAVESGAIDIAFCFDKGELDKRFVKRVVAAEPLVLTAPPAFGSASTSPDLAALAGKSFVATQMGCVYRHIFDRAFGETGIGAPKLAAQVDSIRTIVRLVAAGTGLALLPRLAVVDALDRGEIIAMRWPGPIQTVSLVAIWRRRRVQPPALSQLLALAADELAPVRPAGARRPRAVSSLS